MSETETQATFTELIVRVRRGDARAAEELVRTYEPAIRRAARVRLIDPRLRRVFDSMDVCQSVMASFFVRAALGQYEVETPGQLLGLLAAMARHKVARRVESQRAARRDQRRVAAAGVEALGLAAADPTPSREVAARELLDEARRLLDAGERDLLERRQSGEPWEAIAAASGTTPEALRKRLARAVDRVALRLGLDAGGA